MVKLKSERQRYIYFKVIKKQQDYLFSKKDILKSMWQSIWRYFGMKEATKIGLWLLELEDDYGILRCSNKTKEIIITALTLITEINGRKIILSPRKTTGTIRAIKKIKNVKNN